MFKNNTEPDRALRNMDRSLGPFDLAMANLINANIAGTLDVSNTPRPTYPVPVDNDALDLTAQMLALNPVRRPDAYAIVEKCISPLVIWPAKP